MEGTHQRSGAVLPYVIGGTAQELQHGTPVGITAWDEGWIGMEAALRQGSPCLMPWRARTEVRFVKHTPANVRGERRNLPSYALRVGRAGHSQVTCS